MRQHSGQHEEAMVQALHDAGDEDAAFIMDFEDTVIEAVQESPELASCYHTWASSSHFGVSLAIT